MHTAGADAEPVIQIPIGLPCLQRGRLVKKAHTKKAGIKKCIRTFYCEKDALNNPFPAPGEDNVHKPPSLLLREEAP